MAPRAGALRQTREDGHRPLWNLPRLEVLPWHLAAQSRPGNRDGLARGGVALLDGVRKHRADRPGQVAEAAMTVVMSPRGVPGRPAATADDRRMCDEFDNVMVRAEAGLAMADSILDRHRPEGGMCACLRPLPCLAVAEVRRRRADHERVIAALTGTTQMIPQVDPAGAKTARHARRWRIWKRLESALSLRGQLPRLET